MDAKIIQVGKKGVTPEVLAEIRLLLKNFKHVKVKLLKSSREESDREELSDKILKNVRARKHDLRGNILTLNE